MKAVREFIADPKEKRPHLLFLEAEISRLNAQNATLQSQYAELDTQHLELKSKYITVSAELNELKRLIFGSKSERYVPSQADDQLSLFDAPPLEAEQPAPTTEEITYKRKKTEKKKPKRQALPAHLERIVEIIEPEVLGEGAQKIGEEIAEKYEYTQAILRVKETRRPKYVHIHPQTTKKEITIAPAPKEAFPKSHLSTSLATHILVSKYVDHLPLNRQKEIFLRADVVMPTSTIAGWIASACKVLTPLYDLLVEQVRGSDYLQCDESTIKVKISKDEKKQRRKKICQSTGYYWVAHTPIEKLAVFRYYPSRAARCAVDLLGDFQGVLQTDGYKVYDSIGQREHIIHVACMAHIRRYFEKALDTHPQAVEHCLKIIQSLYAIEKTLRQQQADRETIYQVRQEKAKPIMTQWKLWLEKKRDEIAPMVRKDNKLSIAIHYALGQWDKMNNYLSGGIILIDNNAIENKIRPLALGRKNYLFAGSHHAAQNGAMMYSFFASCKLNNVKPNQWLCHVFDTMPKVDSNNKDQLKKLLPNHLKPPPIT